MTAPIRPKPPSVCNRARDTAAPGRTSVIRCIDGRRAEIVTFLAQEAHQDISGRSKSMPICSASRVNQPTYDLLLALDAGAKEMLAGLEMIRAAHGRVRR